MLQEFPKMLYKAADVWRIVDDAGQEDDARADGYGDHAELAEKDEAPAGGEPIQLEKRTRGPNKAK